MSAGIDPKSATVRREALVLLIAAAAGLVLSGIRPHDRTTWLLEVFPILLGAPLLVVTGRRFTFTPLVYRLMFLHALILMVGGHYTYARVPLGAWVSELLGLARNHYDRLGHVAQGFVPAMIARELLVRTSPLRPGKWLSVIVVAVVLAVSASYELLEWAAALALGQSAADFLGTQGDPWDTQWDMFLALCGAIAALLTLGRRHDRQLATFAAPPRATNP